MKSKDGQRYHERSGIIRLYCNGKEIRTATYTRIPRRKQLISIWQSEIKRLKSTAVFHISIEPEVKP